MSAADQILFQLPTAERFLELTEGELELVLLYSIKDGTSSTERMFTRDGTLSELYRLTGGYDMRSRADVERVLRRAWRSLEDAELIEEPDPTNGRNGYRVVSKKGREVTTRVDLEAAKTRGWLSPELLHADLVGAPLSAFQSGYYDSAVFEAFKTVENKVRKLGGYSDTDIGVELMKKAFDPTTGPLTDRSAPIIRQRARQSLFAGAMGALRNPKAHGDPTITDPREAIEELMTASLLIRMLK
jgi:uncharacterized protein (TIGR02391 family)